MELNVLHNKLRNKQLDTFYVFTGPEWLVQNKYIEQICKVSGLQKKYVEGIADIYTKLKHPSKLTKNYVYIIRDDKELINTEKLHKEIDNGLVGNNVLVLLLTNADKRTKFYKTYKDTIYEFEPLKAEIIKKYIAKEIQLTDSEYDKLIEVCEQDYGRCLLEIDKLKRSDKTLSELLSDGTIYTPPKDAIFEFVDAILDHNVKKVFNLYEQCKAVGEATMVMITVLYDNAKTVLQVQSYQGNNLAKATGLTSWQIKNAYNHLGKYRAGELINIMDRCRKAEKGIKTGTIEEQYAMDYVLVNIL